MAVTDVLNFTLDLAKKLGAEVAINTSNNDCYKQVMDFANNRGVDLVYECAGGKAMPTTLPQASRSCGKAEKSVL